jgi:hypothetical protein
VPSASRTGDSQRVAERLCTKQTRALDAHDHGASRARIAQWTDVRASRWYTPCTWASMTAAPHVVTPCSGKKTSRRHIGRRAAARRGAAADRAGDDANVAALFYSREQPLERYNMADTLKAQHTRT